MNQRPSAILRAGLRWTDNVRESDGRGTTQNTDRKTRRSNSKRQRIGKWKRSKAAQSY